jgi:hypothetical protein
MSRQDQQQEVSAKTQQLLQGPLKHVKAAALAAALLPLASVAAAPASAQTCASGGRVGDYVWQDVNNNGVQDAGEPGIGDAVVSISGPGIAGSLVTGTDAFGYYEFFELCAGEHTVSVQIPPGTQPSPANSGATTDDFDSDGVADGFGNSVALVTLAEGEANFSIDFGFVTAPATNPGTGTPGYWKNHPEAWPSTTVTLGGVTYTQEQALYWMNQSGGDKTLTLFSSLISATFNVAIGNDDSCVASAIAAGNDWLATWGPVGSKVKASSVAWKLGEPIHRLMDNYNNGMLCAPHRD